MVVIYYLRFIEYLSFRLNKCQHITNDAVIRLTTHCTKLESMLQFDCFHFQLLTVVLTVLKLGGLYKLGPEGLASAAHHCPSLVALDIHG